MSEGKRKIEKKFHPQKFGGSGLDNSSFEKAESFLDLKSTNQLEVNDVNTFFQKGFGNQLVQTWAYYSQINDHQKFTSSTITLTKLIKLINEHQELIEHGVVIIKDILTSYHKTLYRSLSSMRPSVTNPTLRLLNEIIIFKDGALLDEFVALFDFTLPVLPKLLIPTKQELADVEGTRRKEYLSIRYCFIRVLLNLLKFSAPLLRKDFISNNPKIFSNWIKNISVIDSDELIHLTLSTWDEKILKEQSFKKVTKLKVFNDWNIPKLLPIYYSTKDPETRSKFNTFILTLATDSKYGLKFPEDEAWLLGVSGNGAIQVNKRNFRTHNKLLYGLITGLKPWDDELQLETVVQILKGTPELIPPFTNYLASRGLHDPKLTSYWLGQTLLLSKIIRLDISDEIESLIVAVAPSKAVITELIVPSVLNRNILSKCLQSDSFLIRQLSIQLIVDSLQKLANILKTYERKGLLEGKVELVNYVYQRLPELSAITTTLGDSYARNSNNKIIQITLLMALNHYVILFNDSFSFSQAVSKPYLQVINKKSFSSIDLVLLDNYFQLQEGEASHLKWWNKSDGSCSLFVSLLKISATNESISGKVTNLLSNLVNQTVIFNNDSLKADPIISLVHSLRVVISEDDVESEGMSKIWKLLDESISRCVRTPFKYLDQSNSLDRISPLILTIIEQWKFVEKANYEVVSKWLVLFLRFSIIFGEPAAVVNKLIMDVDLAFDYKPYLFQSTYESSITALKKDHQLVEFSKSSFFEFITSATFEQLDKFNGIPVDDFEIVGALSRISSIVNEKSLTLSRSENIISKILSLVGNYWFTHPESIIKFSSSKYWGDLFMSSSEEKALYVSGILIEIFSQLDQFEKSELAKVVKSLTNESLSDDQFAVLSEALWSFESADLLAALNHDNEVLQNKSLILLLDRKTIITEDLFKNLLKSSLIPVLSQFITSNLVILRDFTGLIEDISDFDGIFPILKAFSRMNEHTGDLIKFAEIKDDDRLKAFIASSLAEVTDHDSEFEQPLRKLLSDSKLFALNLISKRDFTAISFHELLNIFTSKLVDVTQEEQNLVLQYSLTEAGNKYTSEISNLVRSFGTFDNEIVKIWINKSILYLTKVFAETAESTTHLINFIESFKLLLLNFDITKSVKKSNFNALLEAILTRWVRNESALSFAATISLCGTTKFIDYAKILQILVNNEDNALIRPKGVAAKSRFYTAFIIYRLFTLDQSKNSTASLQEKVLSFYGGSTRPEDLLLFKVLEKIEGKLNSSWIDNVYSWDFLDLLNDNEEELIGETKLIERKKEGYVITINKKYITNGLKSYNVRREQLSEFGKNTVDNWNAVEDFYETVSIDVNEATNETVYDPLFLCLLVINNDELIQVTTDEESELAVKIDIKKLVESGLFASLIINLASEEPTILNVTKIILGSVLRSLRQESTIFKEKHLFELFVTKLLYTYYNNYSAENYSPLIFIMITRMTDILNNPGHILYEKAFRWVLKNPSVRPHEIPLFQEISTITGLSEDTGVYYKQVTWFIEGLIEGVKTKRDIQLLRNKNVIEWILNLQNSPYVSHRIRYKIIEFISIAQKVEDGADLLVTRYAGLTNLKQGISHLQEVAVFRNDTQEAQQSQQLLNFDEIALKYTVAVASKKRLRDWTSEDVTAYNKRVNVTN